MSDAKKNADPHETEKNQWEELWSRINTTGFWVLLGFGALLLVAIIAIAIIANDRLISSTILAAGIPAVLTFVVVVIQAVVAKQMAEIMERQESEMTEQRKAMRESLELTADMFYHSERAYLGISDMDIVQSHEGCLRVDYVLVNKGRTPAWNLECCMRVTLAPNPVIHEPPPYPDELRNGPKFRQILPDTPVPIMGSEIAIAPDKWTSKILSGEKLFIVSVFIFYKCVHDRDEELTGHYIYDPKQHIFLLRQDWPIGVVFMDQATEWHSDDDGTPKPDRPTKDE